MSSPHRPDLLEELAALDAKVNALLPPRYQHCYNAVPPTSMGSAGLVYGPDGRVAWDRIWTTFCDLALAGGPPHRGKLLEPVAEAAAAADPGRAAEVAAEVGRAVGLTTGLPAVEGYAPGWVGVRCASGAQAGWLQLAVTAENVSARRRGDVLHLPSGPGFAVAKEVKNVTVALAKANHYWAGHLTDAQQSLGDADVREPATPAEVAADPPRYEAALAEAARALRPAGLPLGPRRYAGWVNVQLADEEEAAWFLRAVVVERVLARREGRVLYLPVGPAPDAEHAARLGRAFARARRLRAASGPARPSW